MEDRKTLSKSFKPSWVWAIALGSAIGWGAFVQPVTWMSEAGPVGVMIGFLIGGLLMMIIAVSFGFLIRHFPVSGGAFTYAFISLGRRHAFISGWFLTLGYICIVALNATALSLLFKFLLPGVIKSLYMYNIAGWPVYGTEIIIATIALIVFGYINIRGSTFTGRIQYILCLIMLFTIIGLTFMVGFHPEGGIGKVTPAFPENVSPIIAIISIVSIAPWAFVGFDNIPQLAEEFKFSSKRAFSLIIGAIISSVLLYCLMVLVTAMAYKWESLVSAKYEWGTAFAIKNLLGPVGLIILVIATLMGILTGLNGFITSSSRVLFSMSRAKLAPNIFSKLHPKYNTPFIGVIFVVGISMIAPWFGRQVLTWVVDMSSVGVTVGYFYTCFTAYKLTIWGKKSNFTKKLMVKAPVIKFLSLLGIFVSVIFLLLLLIPTSPVFLGKQSLIALIIWIITGFIFYLNIRKEMNAVSEEEMSYLITGKMKFN